MSRKTVIVDHPSTPIENRDQLEYYLYVAMQLEHATIPPYLTAAYTAQPEKNRRAIEDIVAVAREEMLHLSLAANMLNAIGGTPDLLRSDFVPPYPCPLPDGETDFQVSIEAFSASALQTFLKIERPAHPEQKPNLVQKYGAISYVNKQDLNAATRGRGNGLLPAVLAAPTSGQPVELHFWSIGEFYNAIRTGFIQLTQTLGGRQLFCGNPDRQIGNKYFYSGGGMLHPVTDLDSAVAAIDLISLQGEGYTDEIKPVDKDLAHYYRFEQIEKGQYYIVEKDMPHHPSGAPFPRDFSAVFPIKKNGKVADYQDHSEIQKQARRFNCRYRRLLERINQAFNGQPDLLKDSNREMFVIKQDMESLIRNELSGTNENAAPTFEMNQCYLGECP